jgi:hypothetical protein
LIASARAIVGRPAAETGRHVGIEPPGERP